jgi:hypothetical protein
MHDEELHMQWHANLRKLLEGLVCAVYGKGFELANAEVKKV